MRSSPKGAEQKCSRSPSNTSSIACHKNESAPHPDPGPAPPQPEHLPGCVSSEGCGHRWMSTCSSTGGPGGGEEEPPPTPRQTSSTSGSHPLRLGSAIPRCRPERAGRCACGQTPEMRPLRGGCWGVFLQRVMGYQQLQGWP